MNKNEETQNKEKSGRVMWYFCPNCLIKEVGGRILDNVPIPESKGKIKQISKRLNIFNDSELYRGWSKEQQDWRIMQHFTCSDCESDWRNDYWLKELPTLDELINNAKKTGNLLLAYRIEKETNV